MGFNSAFKGLNVLSVLLQDVILQSSTAMIHAWWSKTTFSSCSTGILEHCVSGAVGSTRRTHSMACSFPCFKSLTVLGAFAEIAESDRPSVFPHGRTQIPPDGFSLNLIFEYFWKIFAENSVTLQSDNNNPYFTWRPIYIFDQISLSSS